MAFFITYLTYVIGISIAIFFVIIGFLTIGVTFFQQPLKKRGVNVPDKYRNLLFGKMILEVVAVGFLIFNKGALESQSPVIPDPPTEKECKNILPPCPSFSELGHMSPETYKKVSAGRISFNNGNYPAAERDFSEAIALEPNNYLLYANRANIYLAQAQTGKALEDLKKASALYEALSEQQQHRERMLRLQMDNLVINAYIANNQNQNAYAIYNTNKKLIDDTSDTIMRIYNNLGNAYFSDRNWNESLGFYSKTLTLAQSLDNKEMQILSQINISNSLFFISGKSLDSLAAAQDALTLIGIYKTMPKESLDSLRGSALNSLGLAMGLCRVNGTRDFSLSEIIAKFNEGIRLITPYEELSESNFHNLANLYGNRADAYLASGDTVKAREDYKTACNRFINKKYEMGISRQLVGIYKSLSGETPEILQEKLATILMAQRLGRNKPAVDLQEDSQLRADIESKLSSAQRTEVSTNLAAYLAAATGISQSFWSPLIH